MNIDELKIGMNVLVTKKDSLYDGQMGEILSIYHELTGSEHIRLCIEESGEVIPGFKAAELT